MSYKTDKIVVTNVLKGIQGRVRCGTLTRDDYITLVDTILKLTELVYEPLIEEEEKFKRIEQLESELDNDPFWNN